MVCPPLLYAPKKGGHVRRKAEKRNVILTYSLGIVGVLLPIFAIIVARVAPLPDAVSSRALVYVNLGSPVFLMGSVVLVLRQVQLIFETRLQSHFEEVSASIHEMGMLMLQHSDLYPYFNCGASPNGEISEVDHNRLLALAEVMVDLIDGILLRCATFPQAGSDEDISALHVWARDCFTLSPVMREFVLDREGWYRDEFVAFVKSSLPRPPLSVVDMRTLSDSGVNSATRESGK